MSDFTGYKLPRPPVFRLCTVALRGDHWPDRGEGVWQIEGYENIDAVDEVYVLRRVMPAMPGGGTGERIKFWRRGHDTGHLSVWRHDLVDPKYSQAASDAALPRARKATDEEIRAWADRHGLGDISSTTDLRCMFEDAQTLVPSGVAPIYGGQR